MTDAAPTGIVAIAALAITVLGPTRSSAAERPAPLADEAGCRHYRGTCSGNDPSTQLDVVLCAHPNGVAGQVQGKLQWSSLVSGWNVRRIEGAWSGDTLRLHDVEIVEQRAENGYFFCVIDPYVLRQTAAGALDGTYESRACDDHAQVRLEPVEPGAEQAAARDDAAPPSTTPAPPPPVRPEPPDSVAPDAPPRAGGCGCDPSLMLMLPLLGLRRRRAGGQPTHTPSGSPPDSK